MINNNWFTVTVIVLGSIEFSFIIRREWITRPVRPSVDWLDGQSAIISGKGGKFHFHARIGALVCLFVPFLSGLSWLVSMR